MKSAQEAPATLINTSTVYVGSVFSPQRDRVTLPNVARQQWMGPAWHISHPSSAYRLGMSSISGSGSYRQDRSTPGKISNQRLGTSVTKRSITSQRV